MKKRPSLLTKVLLIAFGNLLVLGAVFLVLIKLQLRLDIESFIASPARDRILASGRLLALQLGDTDPAGWDALVARHAAENRVGLRLVDASGRVLAGNRAPVPAEIVTKLAVRDERSGRARHRGGRHDDYGLAFLGLGGSPARHWAAVPAHVTRPGTTGDGARTWILISSSGDDDLFRMDVAPWIAGAGLVILVSVAFWLPFVRRLTRSISRMTVATAQIAEGHFETRLPAGRHDELGVLGASIERMAARLDRLVNGQKRFLRDAAHELRSPIARIQVALGLLERSATAEQQGVIQDLNEDVQQMSALVDGVLSYSRASQHPAEPRREDVQVASLVHSVLERDVRDSERIAASVDRDLRVWADPDLLVRALSNVVRNAIRYGADAGPIGISAKAEDGSVVITVIDCGPGVPEKDLDAIFEPFYRLESARERATGGVGLGLAIAKSCVESCRGTVSCRNRRPTGLEVEIRLPAAERSEAGNAPDAQSEPKQ